ncbi:hypothetical protein [Liberiplasma polymorphum]|uniref:hypothetical protein n=1 Tax=Liberiplasma polymorphum TaxID=3374570 RepID=UPI003774BDB9
MSVIVAIKQENVIFMGADSQITKGGTRRSYSNPSNYKIWRIKDAKNSLMGGVGLVREINIAKMEKYFNVLAQHNNDINFDYMVLEFVPHLFKTLKENNLIKKEDNEIPASNCVYLVAYKSKLFQVGSDGAVIEIDDFAAIGSGSNEAMGSLLSSQTLSPKERITMAIKASAANDIYVDYPIIISNTNNDVFEVIYENEVIEKIK